MVCTEQRQAGARGPQRGKDSPRARESPVEESVEDRRSEDGEDLLLCRYEEVAGELLDTRRK